MLLELLSLVFTLVFAVPLWVISLELALSLMGRENCESSQGNSAFDGTYKILMPAHNEAKVISETLKKLLAQNIVPEQIIVVADNCEDNTAEIAAALGVVVVRRHNTEQLGKGYALDFGIDFLRRKAACDVLIMLDADCEIKASDLDLLAQRCFVESRPVQAMYLMRHSGSATLKQKVAGFAWLIKNKVRPLAVERLRMPATLMGTGMAFPWQLISKIDMAHGNIVEDMQLGIDCALQGSAPIFCPQALVTSYFPEQQQAIKTQRTRWEHGHLLTILYQVPRLLVQAFRKRDYKLLVLALDIGVPPLSLLMLSTSGLLIFLAMMTLLIDVMLAFSVLLLSTLLFTLLMLMTWFQFGRECLTFKELCAIPVYILSKISVYFTFFINRQEDWVRTDRDG